MSRLLLSALVVLGVGCAGPTGAGPGSTALRLGPADREPLMVQGEDITGPSTSLALKDDSLRGLLRGAALSLELTPEVLSGTINGALTRLEFTSKDDATLVKGSFGGAIVDLRLRGPWLTGRFADCYYDTEQTSEGFVGQRNCSGMRHEQIRVFFPERLGERSPLEQRALLTLALAMDAARYPGSNPHYALFRPHRYSIIPRPTEKPEGGGMTPPPQAKYKQPAGRALP
jgi:hypothetical protein